MLLLLTYHVTSTINVSHISISSHEIYIKRPLIYFTFQGTAPITMLRLNVPLKDKVKPRLEVVNTFSSTQKRECWDKGGYKMKYLLKHFSLIHNRGVPFNFTTFYKTKTYQSINFIMNNLDVCYGFVLQFIQLCCSSFFFVCDHIHSLVTSKIS